jgi:hypothetical protein
MEFTAEVYFAAATERAAALQNLSGILSARAWTGGLREMR